MTHPKTFLCTLYTVYTVRENSFRSYCTYSYFMLYVQYVESRMFVAKEIKYVKYSERYYSIVKDITMYSVHTVQYSHNRLYTGLHNIISYKRSSLLALLYWTLFSKQKKVLNLQVYSGDYFFMSFWRILSMLWSQAAFHVQSLIFRTNYQASCSQSYFHN